MPLSIVILVSPSTENTFDLRLEHAGKARNVTSPARPRNGAEGFEELLEVCHGGGVGEVCVAEDGM